MGKVTDVAGHPTYHVNVNKLKWEIIWTGGLPHLPGVIYLHLNRPLDTHPAMQISSLVIEDFFLKQGVIIIKVHVFSFIDLIMIYNFNNPVIIIILYTCFLWLFCFFF